MKFRIKLSFVVVGIFLVISLPSEITARGRDRYRSSPVYQQQHGGDDFSQSQNFDNVQDYDTWDKVNHREVDDYGQHSVDDPEGWEEYSQMAQRRQRQEGTNRSPSRNQYRSNQRNLPKPPYPPMGWLSTTAKPRPVDPPTEESVITTSAPQADEANTIADGPEVTANAGTFIGKVITTQSGKKVIAFYGIPFAKPPVGDLKFKRPVPIEKFKTTYNAQNLPNACYQGPSEMFPDNRGETQWNPNTKVSEDCLYLNIWVPASIFDEKEANLVSVMYWIYGGGFFSGSSSLDIYNGAVLASENDVIVVSSQYRLGPFGFLYFGTEEAPGNAGMLDQVMALKWTNENIKYFGGDPESITLVGESAGAASVSYHSLSPLTRSLFKRSIILSGVATAKWAFNHPKKARDVSYQLANLAGCDTQTTSQEVVNCLKEVDPDKLIKLQWKLFGGHILAFAFKPTIDGYFLNDMPSNLVGTRDAKRHDIVIGSTQDEGSYFLVYHYAGYFSEKKSTSVPFDKYIDIMRDIFYGHSDFEQDLIIDYYTNWENPNDGYRNQKIISQAVGDAYFTCPIRRWADTWSNRGLKVYFYQFNQRTSSNPWPEWMGVMHADELEYLFGVPVQNSSRFTPGEVDLSKHIMKLFTKFSKSGTPSPNWDRYTYDAPIFLDLNATEISDETTETRMGPDARNCALWNEILPRIRERLANEDQPSSHTPISRSSKSGPRSQGRVRKPAYIHRNRPVKRYSRCGHEYHQDQCSHEREAMPQYPPTTAVPCTPDQTTEEPAGEPRTY